MLQVGVSSVICSASYLHCSSKLFLLLCCVPKVEQELWKIGCKLRFLKPISIRRHMQVIKKGRGRIGAIQKSVSHLNTLLSNKNIGGIFLCFTKQSITIDDSGRIWLYSHMTVVSARVSWELSPNVGWLLQCLARANYYWMPVLFLAESAYLLTRPLSTPLQWSPFMTQITSDKLLRENP